MGSGLRGFDGDGQDRLDTALYWPMDVEVAPDGRLYVLDWQNHRVRRVEADGRVRTVVGSDLPGDGPRDQSDLTPAGAPGATVELNHPTDLAFLADGRLLIAAWHNHKIRRFDPATGRVHVLCGSGPGDSRERELAARALLNQSKSVVVDRAGRIFIADSRNQRLRLLDGNGLVEAVAGTGRRGFGGDGGPPLEATFAMQEANETPSPAAAWRSTRRDVSTSPTPTTTASGGSISPRARSRPSPAMARPGPATTAARRRRRRWTGRGTWSSGPTGGSTSPTPTTTASAPSTSAPGSSRPVAGGGGRGFGGDGGPAAAAALDRPFGVAFDGHGNMCVTDTFNSRVRRVAAQVTP